MFANAAHLHNGYGQGQQDQQGQQEQSSLTEPELEWAWEIKEAIADDPELRAISDFDIAQLAIVTLGLEDLYSVRERVLAMQSLREEYKLIDTPEHGLEIMRGFICDQQPGYILGFDLAPNGRHYTVTFDFAASIPILVKTDEDWRIYLGGFYYMLSAACANLTNIREGLVHLVECDGMGYQNINMSVTQRWAEELAMHFPIETKEAIWLHTPMVANILCSFTKQWMNSRQGRWDRIKLGCKLDFYDGRIDALFNIPSIQAAQEKVLFNVYNALVERYHNQKTFQLPPNPLDRE